MQTLLLRAPERCTRSEGIAWSGPHESIRRAAVGQAPPLAPPLGNNPKADYELFLRQQRRANRLLFKPGGGARKLPTQGPRIPRKLGRYEGHTKTRVQTFFYTTFFFWAFGQAQKSRGSRGWGRKACYLSLRSPEDIFKIMKVDRFHLNLKKDFCRVSTHE